MAYGRGKFLKNTRVCLFKEKRRWADMGCGLQNWVKMLNDDKDGRIALLI